MVSDDGDIREELDRILDEINALRQEITNDDEEIHKDDENFPFEAISAYVKQSLELDKIGAFESKVGRIEKLIEDLQNQMKNQAQVSTLVERLDSLEKNALTTVPPVLKVWVQELLAQLKADGTNKIDYALASNGAKIVHVEQDEEPSSWLWDFFYPLHTPNRRNMLKLATQAIKTTNAPGDCWSFLGHKANLTIKLSCPIIINQMSLEHISLRLP